MGVVDGLIDSVFDLISSDCIWNIFMKIVMIFDYVIVMGRLVRWGNWFGIVWMVLFLFLREGIMWIKKEIEIERKKNFLWENFR